MIYLVKGLTEDGKCPVLFNFVPYISSIICCRVWALVITHHPPILHTAQTKVGICIHFSFMEYAGWRSVAYRVEIAPLTDTISYRSS